LLAQVFDEFDKLAGPDLFRLFRAGRRGKNIANRKQRV
jgi:hypothetical protein